MLSHSFSLSPFLSLILQESPFFLPSFRPLLSSPLLPSLSPLLSLHRSCSLTLSISLSSFSRSFSLSLSSLSFPFALIPTPNDCGPTGNCGSLPLVVVETLARQPPLSNNSESLELMETYVFICEPPHHPPRPPLAAIPPSRSHPSPHSPHQRRSP